MSKKKSPIEQNHGLEECPNQTPTSKRRYQRLVGHFIYLYHTTPNIAYVVTVVSRLMHNQSKQYMDVVVSILRYLKSVPGKGPFQNITIQKTLGVLKLGFGWKRKKKINVGLF